MIFEQLFDTKSSTYTYIISSGKGREALIIDPVIEHTDKYIKVLEKLELKLVKVIDTHIHADHVTGLNELNKRTNCTRIMGEKSKSEVIDLRIKDSEKINIENFGYPQDRFKIGNSYYTYNSLIKYMNYSYCNNFFNFNNKNKLYSRTIISQRKGSHSMISGLKEA